MNTERITLELQGELPSWHNKKDNTVYFSTNYGSIIMDATTREVVYCCIGFFNPLISSKDKYIRVRIMRGEFSIRTGTLYSEYNETCSKAFPYRMGRGTERVAMSEVFRTFNEPKNMTSAIVAVFCKLLELMEREKSAYVTDKAVMELKKSVNNYTSKIHRKPIVARKSVK